MSIVTDIAASYRAPGRVLARWLAAGAREDRALAILLIACALFFVAQIPAQMRAAHLDARVPFVARLYWSGFFMLFILPLLAYGLAAASHLVLRVLGGRGSWFGARLALFWAMLAISPLMLLSGVVSDVAGPGPWADMMGWIVILAFLWLWFGGLRTAEAAMEGQAAR